MERVTSTRGRHRHRQICISSQNSLSSPFLTLRMQFLIFGLWGKFGSFGSVAFDSVTSNVRNMTLGN